MWKRLKYENLDPNKEYIVACYPEAKVLRPFWKQARFDPLKKLFYDKRNRPIRFYIKYYFEVAEPPNE